MSTQQMTTALIIVHGVGDPLPGDALDSVVKGLVGAGAFDEAAPRAVEQRREPAQPRVARADHVATYPVHSATLSRPGQRVLLREVYWGDLSRVKGSLAALVYALFDLVFGFRHVLRVSVQQALQASDDAVTPLAKPLLRCGGWAAAAALWLARGPLFALNILAAAVSLAHVGLGRFVGPSPAAAVAIGSIAVFVAGVLLTRRFAALGWSRSTATAMVGSSALGWALFAWFAGPLPRIETFIEIVTTMMSIAAVLLALAAIATVAVNQLALMLGGVAFDSPETAPLLRAVQVTNLCTTLGAGLFVFVVMIAWTIVLQGLEGEIRNRVRDGLHLFLLVWLSWAAAALGYVVVMAANGLLNWAGSSRPRWRYIVSPLVIVPYITVTLLYGLAFIPLALVIEYRQVCDPHQPWLALCASPWWVDSGAIDEMAQFMALIAPVEGKVALAVTASGALVALLLAARAHLLTAIDLVLDVIAHFRIDESSHPPRTRQWDAMVARFRDVVRTSLAETGASRLVVAAHSQGTMIALQGLGFLGVDDDPAAGVDGVDSTVELILVTVGSPLGHLYHHYFPRRYTLMHHAAARWVNVYRIDDFIGTRIDVPRHGSDAQHAVGPVPRRGPDAQHAVGPRGHVDYWIDREVLGHVVPLVRGDPPGAPRWLDHFDGFTPAGADADRRVLRTRHAGAPVILMHELPGMTHECLDLALRLADHGFTVYLPQLLGKPGERATLRNAVRLCVHHEFLLFARRESSPVTEWLRELVAQVHAEHGDQRVGVIGMCLTGGFVLSMMADARVHAGVMSQPSLPFAITPCLRRALGVAPAEQAAAIENVRRGAGLLALRFDGDMVSPRSRFAELERELGDRFCVVEIPSGCVRRFAHAVLTDDYRDSDGHPTRKAFEDVVAFLKRHLAPRQSQHAPLRPARRRRLGPARPPDAEPRRG